MISTRTSGEGVDRYQTPQRCLPRRARVKILRLCGLLPALLLPLPGCEDGSVNPGNLRFGQIGEVRVQVITPLLLGEGQMQQVLTWNSNGAWTLRESISYRGRTGDEQIVRSRGNPSAFASAYASLITQVNQTPGLRLFIESLDPELDPECGPARAELTFRIRDGAREEEVAWSRCSGGSLTRLSVEGAGPDPDASRVVTAAIMTRDFTVGVDFQPAFQGSLPFGTLDEGEVTGAEVESPLVFLAEPGSSEPPSEWPAFWEAHAGDERPPVVDWLDEMVVVAAVGERFEAGDSVEVRRIVTVGEGAQAGTVVEYVERIPGDFCSPASRSVRPFHIVVAPRTQSTVRFSELATERVPCGF